MPTYETTEHKLDVCPCGKGHTVAIYHSSDNAWSRSFTTYGLNCSNCSQNFVVDHSTLKSRPEYEAEREALSKEIQMTSEIEKFAAQWVDDYFAQFLSKPATFQLQQMQALGISKLNITDFRRARRNGSPFHKLCGPAKNQQWLISLAPDDVAKDNLKRLFSELDAAVGSRVDADTKMMRIDIPRFRFD